MKTVMVTCEGFFLHPGLIYTHQHLSAIIAPYKFMQCHSSEGCLFSSEKTCDRVLEANDKQVPLISYSLKIRIHFVNQILKNKAYTNL